MRVVHPETRVACAAGEVGELWVRSASVARGYWRQPQQTHETFGAATSTPPTGEERHVARSGSGSGSVARGGWLRTGDLGFVRCGEIFVTSRLKDVVVVGGRNLSPTDLEWTVQSALPQLRPGCLAAFAVAPHERRTPQHHGARHDDDNNRGGGDGSLPGSDAVVLVAEVRDAHTTRAATAATVRAAASALRDRFGVSANVVLVRAKSLPKTTSGKIRRAAIKHQYLHSQLAILQCRHLQTNSVVDSWAAEVDVAALAALPPAQRRAVIRRQLLRCVHVTWESRAGPHTPLLKAGLDSAALIQLHGMLQSTYGVPLPPSILLDAPTAHQLAAVIARCVDARPDPTTEATPRRPACASPAEEAEEEEGQAPEVDDAAWNADASALASASASAACIVASTSGDDDLRGLRPPRRRALLGMWALVVAAAALSVWSMGRRQGVDGQPLQWWSQRDSVFEHAKGIRPGWMGRQMDVSHWRLLEWVRTHHPHTRGRASL